ncbi:hypothetical protein [Flavobacterium fluviale]|uniref:Uncharacterized protein n=1 Tax=Flavobacterium fluviale TaxID=2249356 RepID=A0A344LNW4_9FLAO|nr:hypothetical protein [Flavobacterium fluviale]AXB55606.1 hypothetical protein HYN86_02900 [Flavobacterium fluviale]
MEQTLKIKLFPLLLKLTITAIIIFIVTFIQIYWAMGSLSERSSSSCLDCSFSYDGYLMSFISSILLSIVFRFLSFLKNSYSIIFLQLLFLISIWFFWNYSIFVDRESSWSTFLFTEELLHTLTLSFLPISILSIITVFTLHYILKKYESK